MKLIKYFWESANSYPSDLAEILGKSEIQNQVDFDRVTHFWSIIGSPIKSKADFLNTIFFVL